MNHGLEGLLAFWSLIICDGLVGQVLGEVIALLRAVRLFDEMVVFHQVGIPLVGLAAEEAVEAVEALLQRPLLAAGARGDIRLGDVVVLAQPEGAPAAVLQDLPDGGALIREAAVRTGESVGPLGDAGHAVEVVVATGQEGGAGRRAQRRGVPLRVDQPVVRQLLQGRHVDPAAEGRPGGQTGVVVQHEQDVRRAFRRLGKGVRLPVGVDLRTSRSMTPLNGLVAMIFSP